MRLDRFLSGQTAHSRKELTAMIRSGAVTVGGEVVRKPDTQIDPEQTTVTLRGEQIAYAAHHYYLLHKPAGVITASPSFKGVLYLLHASSSSFLPALLNITPQIPPPAQSPLFAAFTTTSAT